MALGNPHGSVAQENRDLLDRNATEQEFHGEGVPKSMGMGALDSADARVPCASPSNRRAYLKCRLANACPEPDFRYLSNRSAADSD